MSIFLDLAIWMFITATLLYLAGVLMLKFAENDIFFTKNVSGRIKAVVAGEQVVKWLAWTTKSHFLSETGQKIYLEAAVVENDQKKQDEENKRAEEAQRLAKEDISVIDRLLLPLGISFIGIWPFRKIFHYKFKWTEWMKKPNSDKYEAVPREKETDHVREIFPYYIKKEGAETIDKTPIDVELLVTIEAKNCSKMLFKSGGEWLANVTGAVQSATRDWVGERTLEQITKAQNEEGNDQVNSFVHRIKSLNLSERGNIGLIEMFGVEIKMVNFLSYENAGCGEDRARIQKATTEEYIARQEAAATRTRAEGEAEAIKTKAAAEAEAIKMKGDAEASAISKKLGAMRSDSRAFDLEIAKAVAEGIRGSKLQTLVNGEGTKALLQLPSMNQRSEENKDRDNKRDKNRSKQESGDGIDNS